MIIHIFTFDFDGSGKLRGPETEVRVSVWALAPGGGCEACVSFKGGI